MYLEVLKEAFFLVWKNKKMWFFGFLVFIGSFSFNFDSGNSSSENMPTLKELVSEKYFIPVLIGVFILAVLLYIVKNIGEIGLIKISSDSSYQGKKKISTIIKETRSNIKKLFLIDLILVGSLFVVLFLVVLPIAVLFSIKAIVLGIIISIIGFCIVVPIVILAVFMRKYAAILVVASDLKIFSSMEMAYSLFRKKIKESILMGLVVLGTSILALSVLFLCLGVVVLPIGLILAGIFFLNELVAIILGFLLAIPILIFMIIFASFFHAVYQSAWVLFFNQITAVKTGELLIEDNAPEIITPEIA